MTGDVHKLGEVLRTAREAKGVDLTRVERDTKIRERYLSALERGDYRDLPGAVYTKGFLRNYGAYLGLDPEYLIDLYRIESAAVAGERPRAPAAPRPLGAGARVHSSSRRARSSPRSSRSSVGGFVAYLSFEFVNFARTPELRIVDPPGNVNGYTELEITIRGETEPNASVKVSNLPENPTVSADADGSLRDGRRPAARLECRAACRRPTRQPSAPRRWRSERSSSSPTQPPAHPGHRPR